MRSVENGWRATKLAYTYDCIIRTAFCPFYYINARWGAKSLSTTLKSAGIVSHALPTMHSGLRMIGLRASTSQTAHLDNRTPTLPETGPD